MVRFIRLTHIVCHCCSLLAKSITLNKQIRSRTGQGRINSVLILIRMVLKQLHNPHYTSLYRNKDFNKALPECYRYAIFCHFSEPLIRGKQGLQQICSKYPSYSLTFNTILSVSYHVCILSGESAGVLEGCRLAVKQIVKMCSDWQNRV